VKKPEADIDGNFRLLALQNLKTVATWVVTASYKYDYATDLSVESLRICEGLLVRVERELGLKVLGSQSSPPGKMGNNNGSGFAEENRYLAKMQKAMQTQVTTCVDASVGVSLWISWMLESTSPADPDKGEKEEEEEERRANERACYPFRHS